MQRKNQPGRTASTKSSKQPEQRAGERRRDEARPEPVSQYGGSVWSDADKRGDKRFGVARNDDADPAEDVTKAGRPRDLAGGGGEASGEREGMARGGKPRKTREREA